MKLYVIAGHGQGDPGACANGYSEAERVRALADRLVKLGGGEVGSYDQNKDLYQQGGPWDLGIGKDVPCLELHQDSASASAKGGHVIIKEGYSPDDYDNALASFVSGFFPGRSQSIVGRSDLQNINVAASVGQNYRLLECCFITNAEDIARFNADIDEFAEGILGCFGIGVEPPKPAVRPMSEAGLQPIPNQAYTGKPCYPEVYSSANATFWTSYHDNTEIGTARATCTGHDGWEGAVDVPFKILPEVLVPFNDIDPAAWYVQYVAQAVDEGYMSGVAVGSFAPDSALTRAQAVGALYKRAGYVMEPLPYGDVQQAVWYHDALKWAMERRIVAEDGTFRPDDACTRAEMCTMLHRDAGSPVPDSMHAECDGWGDVPEWARNSVAWCVEQGIVGDGALRPNDACARAEAAKMLA